MTVYDVYFHADEFADKPVIEWKPEVTGPLSASNAYRFAVDPKDIQQEGCLVSLLPMLSKRPKEPDPWDVLWAPFLETPGVENVTALVFGFCDEEQVIASLAAAKEKLASLNDIFLGDISEEEAALSDLHMPDISPLLAAYPNLEHLTVRGGLDLRAPSMPRLRTLVIQTLGLSASTVRHLVNMDLPMLEELEFWTGDKNYGCDVTIEDIKELLNHGTFPRLRHLGICASHFTDDIAEAIAQSPLLLQLESLDLSDGTLGDRGARALLACPAVRQLKSLNLNHNFCSPAVVAELEVLPITVDAGNSEERPEDDRYLPIME